MNRNSVPQRNLEIMLNHCSGAWYCILRLQNLLMSLISIYSEEILIKNLNILFSPFTLESWCMYTFKWLIVQILFFLSDWIYLPCQFPFMFVYSLYKMTLKAI